MTAPRPAHIHGVPGFCERRKCPGGKTGVDVFYEEPATTRLSDCEAWCYYCWAAVGMPKMLDPRLVWEDGQGTWDENSCTFSYEGRGPPLRIVDVSYVGNGTTEWVPLEYVRSLEARLEQSQKDYAAALTERDELRKLVAVARDEEREACANLAKSMRVASGGEHALLCRVVDAIRARGEDHVADALTTVATHWTWGHP